MRIRVIIPALFLLFVILILGYKIYEYNQLKVIVKTYESNFVNELVLAEESNQITEDFVETFTTFLTQDPEASFSAVLTSYDDVIRIINIGDNKGIEYQREITENQKEYQNLNRSTFILIGKPKGFSGNFLKVVDKYYQDESKSTLYSLMGTRLLKNLFQLLRDDAIVRNHSDLIQDIKAKDYASTLYSISSIEKYTEKDYTLPDENEIKKLYLYGSDVLGRYKDYLKAYYLVAKDYARGDYESSAYKYEKFKDVYANLTVDWDRLLGENDKDTLEIQKSVLEDLYNQIKLLEQFNEEGLGRYPLFETITFQNKDLILCHLYSYKTSLYNSITSKYPEAKTIDDLLNELDTIAPKTKDLDSKFDRSVMEFSNDEKKISFICKDKVADRSYRFVSSK